MGNSSTCATPNSTPPMTNPTITFLITLPIEIPFPSFDYAHELDSLGSGRGWTAFWRMGFRFGWPECDEDGKADDQIKSHGDRRDPPGRIGQSRRKGFSGEVRQQIVGVEVLAQQ